jgi:outer membrane protein insertion porin family
MITARGWDTIYYQRAIWDNWIELRIPLAEDFIWWDFFISATAPYDTVEGILDFSFEDFLFSFGGGARLTIHQLPIGLYLVKRFEIQDGAVEWQSSIPRSCSPLISTSWFRSISPCSRKEGS